MSEDRNERLRALMLELLLPPEGAPLPSAETYNRFRQAQRTINGGMAGDFAFWHEQDVTDAGFDLEKWKNHALIYFDDRNNQKLLMTEENLPPHRALRELLDGLSAPNSKLRTEIEKDRNAGRGSSLSA